MPAPDKRRITSVRAGFIVASLAGSAMVLTCGLTADRRIAPGVAMEFVSGTLRHRIRSGPIVAPVRRVTPVTPPWPEELVAAGDVVPEVLAPAAAPLPERKDFGLLEAAARSGGQALVPTAR